MNQENFSPNADQETPQADLPVTPSVSAASAQPQQEATSAPASKLDVLARRLEADLDIEAVDADGAVQAEEVVEDQGVRFDDLGLNPLLCKALRDEGYTTPTTVQIQAIPAAMNGSDLRVASSTGSGKTAAFMLPALERILAARADNDKRREKGKVHGPRVLVLAPTRELAMQVAKAASTYGRNLQGLRVATIVGGVPYGAQLKALKGPLDILIATPGRLLDHLGTGAAVLSNLEVLVLDEADRMLDMGFIEDIESIAAQTPPGRQTMMFSATFAGHVGRLAERLTSNSLNIDVASHTDRVDNIEQRLHLADTLAHKNDLLDHLLTTREVDQAVVFTSTQRDADILADRLADLGHAVAALHGGMPQGRRNRVLQAMRNRQLRVLVATDVAARGIDVPTITHVINYGMPMKPEDYVHRIGRTGRAGRSGLAVTLCERRDVPMVRRIERFTTYRIPESVIEGLEPKTRMQADRPAPRGNGGGYGKPMPGQRRRDERQAGGFGGGPREGGFGGGGNGYGGDRGPRRDDDRGGFRADNRGPDGGGFPPRRPEGKPFGDRPAGDRPFGDTPFGHKPGGLKAFADKPFAGKPSSGKPFGGPKPFGAKPAFKSGFGGPKRPGFGKREG